MNPKFTPGEFYVSPGDLYDIIGTKAGIKGNVVCLSPNAISNVLDIVGLGHMYPKRFTNQDDSMNFWDANKRLIINAPEMYHLLISIKNIIDNDSTEIFGPHVSTVIEKLLSKIDGEDLAARPAGNQKEGG